jgi:hypothetical protein
LKPQFRGASPHTIPTVLKSSFYYVQTGFGRTYPFIQWVPRSNSPRLKRPGREGKISPQRSAEVNMVKLHFQCPVCFHCLELNRPPLWSSGQGFWLQIRRPGFDSRHCQKKVVGLERSPLSLVSTTEELLDRKVAAPV